MRLGDRLKRVPSTSGETEDHTPAAVVAIEGGKAADLAMMNGGRFLVEEARTCWPLEDALAPCILGVRLGVERHNVLGGAAAHTQAAKPQDQDEEEGETSSHGLNKSRMARECNGKVRWGRRLTQAPGKFLAIHVTTALVEAV